MQNPSYLITKYWTPYVLKSHALLLQNMEPLLPLFLNIKHLLCQDHTPIHYKIWNLSCPYFYVWNTLCAKIIHPFITKYGTPYDASAKCANPYVVTFYYKISNSLSVNFYFTKIENPYFQTLKTIDNNLK